MSDVKKGQRELFSTVWFKNHKDYCFRFVYLFVFANFAEISLTSGKDGGGGGVFYELINAVTVH